MRKENRKTCGLRIKPVDLTNPNNLDAPYVFLALLLENKNKILEFKFIQNHIKKILPKRSLISFKNIQDWQQHFINWIVWGTRHWIIVDKIYQTVILKDKNISLSVPPNWYGFRGDPECYNNGNPNEKIVRELNNFRQTSIHS